MFISTFLSAALGLLSTGGSDTLQTARVVADRGLSVSRCDTLTLSSTHNIEDVLLSFPTVNLSSYGSSAGLKSFSLRGLGSAHSAIYIDGVRLSGVQNGQADIGLFEPLFFDKAVVDYAQNSISLQSSKPEFGDGIVNGQVLLKAASWSSYNPQARLDVKISKRLSARLSADYLGEKGDFPISESLRRENNDIRRFRLAADLFQKLSKGDLRLKAFYSDSRRGTPGSLSYPSDDRQNDRNMFLQATLDKSFSPLYSLKASAKLGSDRMEYLSSWGNSDYDLKEAQLNTSHLFAIRDFLSASLNAGAVYSALESNLYSASRIDAYAGAGLRLSLERLQASLSLNYDFQSNDDASGQDRRVSALSPSAELSYLISKNLTLNAFARRAFRSPTLNELFYPGYANPSLKNEDASMFDLGLDYRWTVGKVKAEVKADVFYNSLKDKIMSAPSEADPYLWLPYNIGKVKELGADVSASALISWERASLKPYLRYAYQKAADVTSGASLFDSSLSQLAYVPLHSLSIGGRLNAGKWNADAVWQWKTGRCDSYGSLDDISLLDLKAGRSFTLGSKVEMDLQLVARNLLDIRWQSVRDYPMPGRSFAVSLGLKF